MYNHEPKNYICPFCLVVQGIENEHVLTKQADIIYKDDFVTAFIGAGWWGNNPGHVIIIPNQHFENIYDLPLEYSNMIHAFEKEVAIALKKIYMCDGVSSRQHNIIVTGGYNPNIKLPQSEWNYGTAPESQEFLKN